MEGPSSPPKSPPSGIIVNRNAPRATPIKAAITTDEDHTTTHVTEIMAKIPDQKEREQELEERLTEQPSKEETIEGSKTADEIAVGVTDEDKVIRSSTGSAQTIEPQESVLPVSDNVQIEQAPKTDIVKMTPKADIERTDPKTVPESNIENPMKAESQPQPEVVHAEPKVNVKTEILLPLLTSKVTALSVDTSVEPVIEDTLKLISPASEKSETSRGSQDSSPIEVKTRDKGDMVLVGSDRTTPSSDTNKGIDVMLEKVYPSFSSLIYQ